MRFVRRRYHQTVNSFSNIEIPENVAEFQIIDRQVLDALLQLKDCYPYIRVMLPNAPMWIAIFFGLGMAALSLAYGLLRLVLTPLQPDAAPPAFAAPIFLPGVQLVLLGVLGEYIDAIHFQVRQSDIFVEREVINMEPRSPSRAATAETLGGSLDTVQGVL